MNYPAYPTYKESCIPWLGKVPEHWEVKRLKLVADTIMGQSPNSDQYTDDVKERPFLQGNAEFGQRFPSPKWFCDAALKIAPIGAILLSVRAPVGAINEADNVYSIGRGLCAIVCRTKDLVKNFCWYSLQLVRIELHSQATGSTYDAVSSDNVGNLRLALPSLSEQTAIADFLDRETGRIDTLIEKKRRLIALLKEKRGALISRTVTRGLPAEASREFGLEPHTRFKDSGIEWLGEVPDGWEVKRLKMFAHLNEEKVEADPENPLTYIGLENIETGTGRLLSLDKDVVPSGIASKFSGTDTLFGKLRPYLAKGCNPGFSGLCSTELLVLETKEFDRRAFLYWLLADGFIQLVDSSTYGSKMPRANWNFIGNCRLPVPSLPEQTAIATYLDRETAKIEKLTAKVEQAIERLQEYRTALITSAVTGKIDVRYAVDSAGSLGLAAEEAGTYG